jgi:hypothetical protein
MADSTISAMLRAMLPLTNEPVPCVQGTVNKQAPALAFGIPATGGETPAVLGEFQTWIDNSTEPARLSMVINGGWIELYRIAADGTLTISTSLTMPGDPTDDLEVATKHYVDHTLATIPGALIFRGMIDCSTNPDYPAGNLGDFYIVAHPGKIGGASGANVLVGDTLLCRVDDTASGNQAGAGLNWSIGQAKLQNIAIGPGAAVSGDFAQFDGTSGTLIKDGGVSLDTDPTMAANSDGRIPSQKAVKNQLGGKPLANDTPAQGQVWMWDVPSASFRAGDCEGRNLLVNPSFDVWQENSSYTLGATVPKTHIADFWKAGAGSVGGRTAFLAYNGIGNGYAVRFQRPAGFTDTGRFRLVQQFDGGWPVAGNTVMVSFDFQVGANYSPTNGPYVTIYWAGNAGGSVGDLDLRSTAPSFASSSSPGSVASPSLSSQVVPYDFSRIVAGPFTIPAGVSRTISVTAAALEISSGDYAGASGSDDSFAISNVKLEIGTVATPFRRPDPGEQLQLCRRRYQSTFMYGSPASGTGTNTGELMFRRIVAGTASEGLYVPLPVRLRAAPAVSLFNPIASNTQVRNTTKNADCAASAVDQISDHGFRITCTGNSTGVAGDWLSTHYVADARL